MQQHLEPLCLQSISRFLSRGSLSFISTSFNYATRPENI